ncbi:MAG: AEC family transporter [Clostridia bacterium]|nr:AEC family transporter [Clostridia bacterium]
MQEFFGSVLTVGSQVLALFVMMAFGFVMYKTKLVDKKGIDQMTDVLLWTVTPCLLIETFYGCRDTGAGASLMIFAACAAASMLIPLLITLLMYRGQNENDRPVMRFGTVFSNCGFMGLPLAQAVFGAEGVMYASIFVAVFMLLQWTAGYALMSDKGTSIKKALLNPGVIGFAVSLPLLFLPFSLPEGVLYPIKTLASMNTPLAMVVIGAKLACADLKKAFSDGRVYLVSFLRLLVVPAAVIAALVFIPVELSDTAKLVLVIEAAAPTAATTALISAMTNRNSELGSGTVAVTTLISSITLPMVSAIAKIFLI